MPFSEKLALFLEVSLDGLAYLDTLHVQFVMVADYLTLDDCLAVGEDHVAYGLPVGAGTYLRDCIAFVFKQFVRLGEKGVSDTERLDLSARPVWPLPPSSGARP